MLAWILLLGCWGGTPPLFQAQPLAGEAVTGELKSATAEQVVIDVSGQSSTFAASQLRSVVAQPPAEVEPGEVSLELIDGTRLTAAEFTVANSTARVTLSTGPVLEFPVRKIRWAQLKRLADQPELLKQWDELGSREVKSDTIAFRRGEGTGAQMDQLEGVLFDITADNVEFQFDDARNSLKRAKVDGVLYLQSPAPAWPREVCHVVDSAGDRWRVRAIEMAGDSLRLKSLADVDVLLPLEKVRQIDFAAVNITFLSDLDWTDAVYTPYIPSQLKQAWFAPRRDQNFQGEPLQLAGRRFAKGLALHSKTELSYRLRDPFQRFKATVGIDDQVRQASVEPSVELSIVGDGKTLYAGEITGSQEPIELDLDVSGVRRLSILVDYGRDIDIADHLDLAEARLIK